VSRADRRVRKAEKRAARRRRRGGFVMGALMGAVVGLLVAPKSGKETRQKLLGDGGLGEQVDRVRKAVGAGRDSASDQSEALRRKIEETRERLRHQAGDDAERQPSATS
jgi:gas vesicle protein